MREGTHVVGLEGNAGPGCQFRAGYGIGAQQDGTAEDSLAAARHGRQGLDHDPREPHGDIQGGAGGSQQVSAIENNLDAQRGLVRVARGTRVEHRVGFPPEPAVGVGRQGERLIANHLHFGVRDRAPTCITQRAAEPEPIAVPNDGGAAERQDSGLQHLEGELRRSRLHERPSSEAARERMRPGAVEGRMLVHERPVFSDVHRDELLAAASLYGQFDLAGGRERVRCSPAQEHSSIAPLEPERPLKRELHGMEGLDASCSGGSEHRALTPETGADGELPGGRCRTGNLEPAFPVRGDRPFGTTADPYADTLPAESGPVGPLQFTRHQELFSYHYGTRRIDRNLRRQDDLEVQAGRVVEQKLLSPDLHFHPVLPEPREGLGESEPA